MDNDLSEYAKDSPRVALSSTELTSISPNEFVKVSQESWDWISGKDQLAEKSELTNNLSSRRLDTQEKAVSAVLLNNYRVVARLSGESEISRSSIDGIEELLNTGKVHDYKQAAVAGKIGALSGFFLGALPGCLMTARGAGPLLSSISIVGGAYLGFVAGTLGGYELTDRRTMRQLDVHELRRFRTANGLLQSVGKQLDF